MRMDNQSRSTLTPKTSPEIYPLTGIRALAALWVLLFHLHDKLDSVFPAFHAFHFLFDPVVLHGYLGVDLFFILSGFIISYNYAQRFSVFRISTCAEFLWMRLARLWPVHFVVLALYVSLCLAASQLGESSKHPGLYSWGTLFQNLILVHAWSIPIHESWNVPAWSISCEWMAYLIFPGLILSKAVTRSVRLSTVTGAAALLMMILALQGLHDAGSNKFGLIRIAGEFVTGCCLCKLFQAGVGRDWNWNIVVSISLLAILLLLGFLLPLCSLVAYWCVPFLVIVVLGLAYNRCGYSRLMATRPLLFGGYISYSLYMVHTFCLIVLHHLFPTFETKPVSLAIDLIFPIVAATAMFRLVEDPCRKQMRKLYPRVKPQPCPAV